MKQFESKDIPKAHDYVAQGGQVLHVWKPPKHGWQGAPACFMRSRKIWGHLLDADKDRLIATARRLGVRVIKVAQEGRRGQHVDLCGKPLQRAIAECEREKTNEAMVQKEKGLGGNPGRPVTRFNFVVGAQGH